MSPTVLVTDHTWPSLEIEREVLAEVGARLVVADSGSEQELVELARDADAILTCFAKVTGPVIRAAPRLRVIGRYGIGVDNIDVAEATSRGIPVTNVPAYCLDEVCEHALSLILALTRKLLPYDQGIRDGSWDLARGQPIRRVAGSTLGVLGFGRIGQRLARKARGLDMHVMAYDPNLEDDAVRRAGADPVSLEELMQRADHISVHVPLTPDTQGLVDERLLALMQPHAVIVNTARGGIIDQNALAKALSDGHIAGAALDVFEPEHLPADHPLLAAPNLLVTPHVAFYSEQSVRELERLAAQNVAAVLDRRPPENVVNPEVLERG